MNNDDYDDILQNDNDDSYIYYDSQKQQTQQFYNQDDEYPKQKYVAGFLANEIQLQSYADRDDYSNWEVNQHLGQYFRFFGKKDMDIVYLYFVSKKKQEQIMTILGKSQPAVSYDVKRIRQQIEFVIKLIASIDDFIMFITDPENKMKTFDKQMLTIFFYSTSIVKTARLLNINNITCRSHLNTIVNRLLSNGYIDMYNLFKYILNNLNNIKKFVQNKDDKL